MSYGYDEQLIDAVGVRRKRVEAAFLLGDLRLRRTWSDRTSTFLIAAFFAVLAAAGCVAVSFVTHLLANDTILRPSSSTTSSVGTR
ncbi:MAG: hypothetical protein ACRCTR_01220 [Actinomycetota bacterium]